MSATVWYVIEIIGFALAAVFLILNVILFIKLKVPTLVEEISGKRFEKEVKMIRERNMTGSYRGAAEARRPQGKNIEAVYTPDRMQNRPNGMQSTPERVQVTPDRMQATPDGMQNARPQEMDTNSTSILSYDTAETMVLSNKTSILDDGGVTTVLNADAQFRIVREIVMVHTDERIL